MLIRNNELMEKGMSITYEDIKKQRANLESKYRLRKAELQKYGHKLVHEYCASLSLTNSVWRDSEGDEYSYVSIGSVDEKGKFHKKPLESLSLSENYELKFKIATTVDDSPLTGGDLHAVSISMWIINGNLHVDVGGGQKEFIISSPSEEGVFIEVCSAIKQLIIMSFTDSRLD
ncbi:hypothetical protein [Xenorhabdus ishibashii]|uniref:Uncharacterized protein n=1 Tax=Xenorhabdus ishibashii TaxID=1034471 RepID=A0A2D0KCK6_9GAMM|nr:hypothetical protein [Xenorhabdus ishibashii]PHM61184.1 hypothetical protein Xish_00306 [Xenorhabdus ishibashii]